MAVAGLAVAAGSEAGAWGLWAKYDGGQKTTQDGPGQLYVALHVTAAVAAAVGITGLALYLVKRKEKASTRSSARKWLVPVVGASGRGGFVGLRGEY